MLQNVEHEKNESANARLKHGGELKEDMIKYALSL